MVDRDERQRFEHTVMPHTGAAYNLARWLCSNEPDAEDAVQDACLRALRAFGGFRGGDSKAWFLAIVRNTCYTLLARNRFSRPAVEFDEMIHGGGDSAGPEKILLESTSAHNLRKALENLPPEFREVVVLRELEGLSYKEIAHVANLPIGTVMSRLARARARLVELLRPSRQEVKNVL